MRFTSQTHCPDCFSASAAQPECERCRFNRLFYQDNALYLPEFSLLGNGRYVTGRVLGKPGGFGIVYCGWHQGLHRRLAIKEFFPRELANRDRDSGEITTGQDSGELFEGWKHRFLREARLLARFQSNPHVVTALDVFEENGTAYMIMERLDGQNLNEFLGGQRRDEMGRLIVNRKLSFEQARVLMNALLSALQTLHEDASEPLYHRDLTFNNILLPEGELAGAKLLDFGLARSGDADPRHTTTVGVGTPGFAAPEQLQREGRIGPYTDFYALGAIFYAALSGQLPPSSYDRVLGQPLTPLAELAPDLDRRWCALIDACLDMNPQRRPQSVAEIRERLAESVPASPAVITEPRIDTAPHFEPEMVFIKGDCFQMGSPSSEKGRHENERQHEVCVEDFYIGKYTVTFDEYDYFAKATGRRLPGDEGWGRGRRPVINVSWHDAVAYLDWLSQQTGKRYRLPTEAEWEYAARAGTTTAYWWGDDIGRNRANCDGCGSRWDGKQTAPVGSFAVNPWGLYDTAGNVWEWICSEYDSNYGGSEKRCASRHDTRFVTRGGSWGCSPHRVRSANRAWRAPDDRNNFIGFRPARSP